MLGCVNFTSKGERQFHCQDSLAICDEDRFVVFDNENSEVPYRIPAIAKTRDGDLIAVADFRHSKADIGMVKNGRLDLHYRIRNSQTGEWNDVSPLVDAIGEGDSIISFGDPCIVADRESERVLVTSCSGNVSFPKGTHGNHQGWARFVSEDGGKTWGDYEEISDQVFRQLDKRNDGEIRCFFIGSGKITQSKKVKVGDTYRLYCAALVKTGPGVNVNYVFYSDDFGKTWNLLGEPDDCPIPEGADEPKTEELPDGNILISSRVKGGRLFNIFHFDDAIAATGSWDKMVKSSTENNGLVASSNACNGELLLVPVTNSECGTNSWLLLQSVPLNSDGKRANVGINFKELSSPSDYKDPESIASNWDGVYEVTPKNSAYSTMVEDSDGSVAFLFEENVDDGGYDIIYKKLSIDEITNGKYRKIP